MATVILNDGEIKIPGDIHSLEDFRAWTHSPDFPERVRIDYLHGQIVVGPDGLDYYLHGAVKQAVVVAIHQVAEERELGIAIHDSIRFHCFNQSISIEPDVLFARYESINEGKLQLPRTVRGNDNAYEAIGVPELVGEIVCSLAELESNQRLLDACFRAGVQEYWRIFASKDELVFEIFHRETNEFVAAPVDSEQLVFSKLLETRFRLSRIRNRSGNWMYKMEREVS